jgi:glycosyltransferase involved in cell wall biosynthesis
MVEPAACVDQLERQNITVHSLDMKAGRPDLRALFRLKSVIQSFRPDIVHCHMFHANILGRITRLFCQIPTLISTAHNTRETSQGGGPTWHKELLYRATDRLADRTTVICNAGFERYLRVKAAPPHKLCMIPNGIDTEMFTRSEPGRQRTRKALGLGSEFVWLAVGRLVKQKDYPTLLRALQLLKRRDFTVLIAGEGRLQGELEAECDQRGLSGHVRFCGLREDIQPLYNAADAFVMSSEFEGLSLALMEAAAMGLPAVVTRAGGNPEIVAHGLTGYLVPPGDSTQLSAALQRLMETTPDSLRIMSRAARRHCLEHYRMAAVMDQWLDLYAEYLPAVRLDYEPSVVA